MREFVNFHIFALIVFTAAGICPSRGQQSKCEKNPTLGTNTLWKCTNRTKCAPSSALPLNNTVHCGSGKICCPEARSRPVNRKTSATTAFAKANQIALKKCYEYADYRYRNFTVPPVIIGMVPIQKYVLECRDNTEALIIGGYYIHRAEFPHTALLGHDEDVTVNTNWLCGGSLISDRFILSAAHCTKTAKGELVKWAALGVLYKSDITDAAKGTSILRIKERFNHPLYKAGKSTYENNDIALYQLEKKVTFSPFIRPICIHFNSSLSAVRTSVQLTGWESLANDSYSLRKAAVDILDSSDCSELFEDDPKLEKGFDQKTMICGGNLFENTNICNDSTGGSLQIRMPELECMMIQIGITSRAPTSCGENSPAIYTRVSTYLQWIQKIVWPEKAST